MVGKNKEKQNGKGKIQRKFAESSDDEVMKKSLRT